MVRRKSSNRRNFTIVDIGDLQKVEETEKETKESNTINPPTGGQSTASSPSFVLPSYSVTQHPSVTIKTPEAGKKEAQSSGIKTAKGGISSSFSSSRMEDVPFDKHSHGGKTSTSSVGSNATPSPLADSSDKTKHIQEKIDDVTQVMDQNVKNALARGERFQDLEAKTEALETGAKQFSKNAQQVRKNLWWKNMKMTIYVAIVILIIVAAIGGYFAFSGTHDKKEDK